MNLNEKLIKLSYFYCSLCKNILTLPIFMNRDVGNNICGSCFVTKKSDNDLNYIPNNGLESILKLLNIPCRNKTAGCSRKLLYDDMIIHEKSCLYQTYNCPIKGDCSWNGSTANLQEHFKSCHSDLLFTLDSLRFEQKIDFSIDFKKHMLLIFNSEMFLLQIKVENDDFLCALCYIGDEDKGSKYEYYVMEIKGKSILSLNCNMKKPMLSQYFMNMIDKDRAINIDMVPLRSLFGNDHVVTIKFCITNKDIVGEVDEQLLLDLECPVCKSYMLTPIHQCLTGHNICSSCRSCLNQCPICCGQIGQTRNFALEEVSSRTIFPCVYRSQGCYAILSGAQLKQHEQQCIVRMHSCVNRSPKCSWQGNYREFVNHIQLVHNGVDSYEIELDSILANEVKYKYLVTYEDIFLIAYKYDEKTKTMHWNCRMFRSNNYKFKFRITYRNDTKDISKSTLCLPFTTDDDFFNNSISFSVRSYIFARCEIIKST